MYIPEVFKVDDPTLIKRFLIENQFGTLIQSGDAEPVATNLPFLLDHNGDSIILEGHMALANDQAKFIKQGKKALVTFMGPHGYISSSVYGHPNVPTWNYQAVHVYGTISVMSTDELIEHLNNMVHAHESERTSSLDLKKLPAEMLEMYFKEIIGFKITSYKTEAAFKLSQNRNEADFQAIIEDLKKDPSNHSLVRAMLDSRK